MAGLFARAGSKTRTLLQASDFAYLGYYKVDSQNLATGINTNSSMGLGLRYVGGSLRFILLNNSAIGTTGAIEVELPAGDYGGTISAAQKTNSWADLFSPAGSSYTGESGCWYDSSTNKFWVTNCADYPDDPTSLVTLAITVRTLDAVGGTISNFGGWWGFQDIGQRAVFGGMVPVPSWFQAQYGLGPYLFGFGGYTSRMTTGLVPSLGFMAVFSPDPEGYAANSSIPSTDYKIGADHRSGTTQSDYNLATGDRGIRSTAPRNYFDGDGTVNPQAWESIAGAATFSNGSDTVTFSVATDAAHQGGTSLAAGNLIQLTWTDNYCTVQSVAGDYLSCVLTASYTGLTGSGRYFVARQPPTAGARWQSPAPDGNNRWAWGDTYAGTAVWIDTPSRTGLVVLASLCKGAGWYQGSTLNDENRDLELHIYDPADLASAAQGSLDAWRVQPHALKVLTPDVAPLGFSGPVSSYGSKLCVGAAFDAATKILWLWCPQAFDLPYVPDSNPGYTGYLIAYSVDC